MKQVKLSNKETLICNSKMNIAAYRNLSVLVTFSYSDQISSHNQFQVQIHFPANTFLSSKTSSKKVFKTSSLGVFKTSSRSVCNTSSKKVFKTSSSRSLQDVFRKTSCNYVLKLSSRRLHQDECKYVIYVYTCKCVLCKYVKKTE